ISNGNRKRAPGTPFACHGNNDRNRQASHLTQISPHPFGLSALLRIDARISAWGIDKCEDRPSKLRRQLHNPQRFPVALRLGLAEVAQEPLLCVAAFLMADDRYRASMKLCESRNQGFVIAKAPVTVQFHKICEEHPKVIQRVGPLSMPRNLSALPWAQMTVELLAQLSHLLANAFQLRVSLFVASEPSQFLDVLLQAFDFALAIHLGHRVFWLVRGLHHITRSTDWSPIHSLIAEMSSGHVRTRFSACSVAVVPSEAKRSSDTGLDPRYEASTSSRRSSNSSFNSSSFTRIRRLDAGRSASSPSRAASCKDSRVPASSTCTRALSRRGAPALSICSSRAKLSGKASNSCTPVMSWIVKIAQRAPFLERIGRVPTMSAATVISLPFRWPSTWSSAVHFISCSRESCLASGCPDT